MHNHFCKHPLWEVTQTLAAVAQGRQPADTVIRGGTLVNVCTAEFQENIDIAIAEGRISMNQECFDQLKAGSPPPPGTSQCYSWKIL